MAAGSDAGASTQPTPKQMATSPPASSRSGQEPSLSAVGTSCPGTPRASPSESVVSSPTTIAAVSTVTSRILAEAVR